VAYVGALVIIMIGLWAKWFNAYALWPLFIFTAYRFFHSYYGLLLWPNAIEQLLIDDENNSVLTTERCGNKHAITLLHRQFVTQEIIVLRFKRKNSYFKQSIVIFRDAMAQQDYCYLQYYLRTGMNKVEL